jgi:hypothetical protein
MVGAVWCDLPLFAATWTALRFSVAFPWIRAVAGLFHKIHFKDIARGTNLSLPKFFSEIEIRLGEAV